MNESNQPVNVAGDVVSNGENIVKAAELSGSNFRLFIEDSQTGEIICKPNTKVIQLNEALHSNSWFFTFRKEWTCDGVFYCIVYAHRIK